VRDNRIFRCLSRLGKRIQNLPRFRFLSGFLDRFLIRRVHGNGGGFPSRDVHPSALWTDRCFYLDRLKNNFLSFCHRLGLFVLYMLVFMGRDGESGSLGGYVGGRFK